MADEQMDVYLEVGRKKTFACALEWPGWCRSGRDEESALQALLDQGPRYEAVMKTKRLGFRSPKDIASLHVVERLKGDATTDFGAPSQTAAADARPVDDAELQRFLKVLEASWQALDAAAAAATGKELRKGPRGGGRELEKILQHVLGAEGGYLTSIGWKHKVDESGDVGAEMERTRQAIREGLAAAVHGELPSVSPRGKQYWLPRYYVRRAVWHVLDHVWEIEDRIL
jgi:hypothetical protein